MVPNGKTAASSEIWNNELGSMHHPPTTPFHVKISEVTVQPKHFMPVCISFKPKSENPDTYEDILIFEKVSTKAQLCCKLFGKVLQWQENVF